MRFSWGIRGRLIAGFSVLCLLLAGTIGMTMVRVDALRVVTERMAQVRMPTAIGAGELASDIYASLAALRGWMITGNPSFKEERAAAWSAIDAERAGLDRLAAAWTGTEDAKGWSEVKALLEEFRAAQEQIEAIAHTLDEQPAAKILATEAAPLAGTIFQKVTRMIDEEGAIPSDDARKTLLLGMADLRGSMGMAVASIRAYLLTGDATFRSEFETLWAKNEQAFAALIARRGEMTETQKAAFEELAQAREKFAPLPEKMFGIRASDRWNVAQHLLTTEAAPRAGKILDVLQGAKSADGRRVGGMVARHRDALVEEGAAIERDAGGLMTLLFVLLGFGLGVAATIVYFTTRSIVPPILGMTRAMGKLADGDLETEVPGTDKKDEIGLMAKAVLVFKENMAKAREAAAREAEELKARERRAQQISELTSRFDADVTSVLKTVASASTELHSTATSMSSTAEETTRQATTVAAATEQASANVQTVATAAEELASSVAEIARQVTHSSDIAKRAVGEAERTNETVRSLDEAARRIGDVVALINDIAGQTNLLALNATIEAARAGEAGKGFAVVASEVKTLANQTAKATEDIKAQIAAIQAATGEAVAAIQGIGGTISELSGIAASIASAVEEQGSATQEIARNVQEAAAGTQQVSSNIGGVSQAANDAGAAAHQVLAASEELAKQAETLRSQVETFIAQIKAA
jgi:methyl-accepting chemotaxis protein